MKPALHEDNTDPREVPNDELALVARGGAHWEVWDLPVGQHHAVLHQASQTAEAGAADHPQDRPHADRLQDVVSYRLQGLPGQRVRTCCWTKCWENMKD